MLVVPVIDTKYSKRTRLARELDIKIEFCVDKLNVKYWTLYRVQYYLRYLEHPNVVISYSCLV